MEQIIQNISDPSWWFTGTFFVILGILLTKLIFEWLPKVWRKFAVTMPELQRTLYRWKEIKVLKIIKRYRQHEVKVNWLIGRYWCLATASIFYMSILMFSYFLSENNSKPFHLLSLDFMQIIKYLPIVAPAYMLTFMTMWEKRILKRTINAHIKWKKRITNPTS